MNTVEREGEGERSPKDWEDKKSTFRGERERGGGVISDLLVSCVSFGNV